MGTHDKPSAGKTPDGKRGAKPTNASSKVQTSGGAYLWKQIASIFPSKKAPKKKGTK
jgi:hypothetical protein